MELSTPRTCSAPASPRGARTPMAASMSDRASAALRPIEQPTDSDVTRDDSSQNSSSVDIACRCRVSCGGMDESRRRSLGTGPIPSEHRTDDVTRTPIGPGRPFGDRDPFASGDVEPVQVQDLVPRTTRSWRSLIDRSGQSVWRTRPSSRRNGAPSAAHLAPRADRGSGKRPGGSWCPGVTPGVSLWHPIALLDGVGPGTVEGRLKLVRRSELRVACSHEQAS